MKTLIFALVCVFMPIFTVRGDEQQLGGWSPSGRLEYETRGTVDAGKEIWFWQKDQKEKANKLCDTEGWGNLEVFCSFNDCWVVIQDGGASLGVRLRLFRRVEDARFQEQESVDINGEAERTALKQAGLSAVETLDHRYVHCLAWSADSKGMLVQVSGAGRTSGYAVRVYWVGIYNLDTGRFTADLNEFNGQAVEKTKLEE